MIGGKLEYSKQIHLRFGYFESNLQADNLPANLTVNVNGRPASLPVNKLFIYSCCSIVSVSYQLNFKLLFYI